MGRTDSERWMYDQGGLRITRFVCSMALEENLRLDDCFLEGGSKASGDGVIAGGGVEGKKWVVEARLARGYRC